MGRPAPAVALSVTLSDDQLDALAELVARKLLASTPGDAYDQEHLPPGMTRRTFLDAARAGRFPTRKVGRKVVASKADVDAWRATLPSAHTVAGEKRVAPDNDVEAPVEALDPDVARLATLNAARKK